jgi:hypothetical protein
MLREKTAKMEKNIKMIWECMGEIWESSRAGKQVISMLIRPRNEIPPISTIFLTGSFRIKRCLWTLNSTWDESIRIFPFAGDTIQLRFPYIIAYFLEFSDEKSMLKFIVAVGFWVVVASHHFVVNEFQFLLGSLAHDDFFVVFLCDDC